MSTSRKNYNDLYMPHDNRGVGQLKICGRDTRLKLLSSKPIRDTDKAFRDQHGFLKDGSKASLLGCVELGSTQYWSERRRYETRFYPQYVLIGERFIASDDAVIKAIHYHFENVDCLMDGRETFGTINPTRDEFVRILEAEEERVDKIAREHGWDSHTVERQIGERPMLQYFSGCWEILKCDAEVGSVRMANRISHDGLSSPKGTSIENEITVSLRFVTSRTVEETLSLLGGLHSFFELCLGRRQRYLWIEADLVEERPETNDGLKLPHEVHWSYCNERVFGETGRTNYFDNLVCPGTERAEFARVLSGWLNSEPVVGDARGRFCNAFHSGSYSVDRIVGAANMFDLLPDSYVPLRKELDEPTRELVDETRNRFKELPESFARQSMLSALGRIGSASLADKICHRADIVMAADSNVFSELHLPCRQAVVCRNHYVHGSEGPFDYREKISLFVFLVDTLEFVFAASELIELGWNYGSWRGKRLGSSHKFGSYVASFGENLRDLKRALNVE